MGSASISSGAGGRACAGTTTRIVATALLAMAATLTVACGDTSPTEPPAGLIEPPASAEPSYGPQVVHLGGVGELRLGETERELADRGVVVVDVPGCAPRATHSGAGPVFVDGRLTLIWADPPLRTPEGLGVGSTIAEVRRVHPDVTKLAAPQGTYRLDGLLATADDRAYLFLHDGRKVEKVIVGYADQARRLFARGFTGC